MITLPRYLPLLDHIKDLFPDPTTLSTDKDWLINWATRIEVFRLQQQGNAVSEELVQMIQADFSPLLALLVRLNSDKDKSMLVDEFHQQADEFYKQLNALSVKGAAIKSNKELTTDWLTERENQTKDSDATIKTKTTIDDSVAELSESNAALTAENTVSETNEKSMMDKANEQTKESESSAFFGSLFDDDDW
ncbi:MAG: hypothetical protein ACI9LM_003743 [Alteromonadaceae bacterium]|jgi:hypothetical protein